MFAEIRRRNRGFPLFYRLRGRSRFQPPKIIGGVLRFIGRHTLEIYAVSLAASEILVWFVPSLEP